MSTNWIMQERDGLHVHVLPTLKYKMISVLAQLSLPLSRGRVTETALLPPVLMRGTRQHPTPEGLMRAFDDHYGASFSVRAGKHGDTQTLEFICQLPGEKFLAGGSGLFTEVIGLLVEVMLDPYLEDGVFGDRAVEVEKTLHRQRIENIINDKIAYSAERCVAEMCAGEAFGIPRFGFVEDIDRVTPQSLFRSYKELFSESPVHLYIVGPVDGEATIQTTLNAFSAYSFLSTDSTSLAGARFKMGEALEAVAEPKMVIEHLDVNQGKLNMGLRASVSYRDDDYPALIVYNAILGGFPTSKLFVNVREKASLAYYASSRLEGLKGYIFISSGIQISDYERARDIIETQLRAMQAGDISDEELALAQNGLINQYQQSDDQPLTGAMMQMYARMSGRRRTVAELIDAVRLVTKEDVVRVAAGVALDTVYFLRDKEA